MKKYSVNFNKRSRLHKLPELDEKADNKKGLDAFDASELKKKITNTLKIQNDFFPCFDWTFPPPLFSKSSPPDTAEELFSKPSVVPNKYSLYLHSPFCKTLCKFCYYSVLPGKGIEESDTYVNYLIKEMALYSERMRGSVCESVYIGGGTPTFLENELLIKLMGAIYDNFNIHKEAEISIEAAPGTLPIDKIALLKMVGVNRLSYGIQTLDEKMLAGLNRHYSVSEAITELENALEVIGNVNVDTMYGFDGEPDDALEKTLDRFYKIGVPSLSIYSLDKQRSEHKSKMVPPKDARYEQKIEQFEKAKLFLAERGYDQVLQNVFVNPENGSYKHQLRRWDNLSLVAIGLSAQGYAPKTSYQNHIGLKNYYARIDEGKLPISAVDHLTPDMEMCRELTSKLRFTNVDVDNFNEKYGIDLDQVFGQLIKAMVDLEYMERENNIIKMTSKSAYYNNIIPMLFSPDEFKEELLGLPEEYLEEFPVPNVITKLGSVQSAPIDVNEGLASLFRYNQRGQVDRRSEFNKNVSKNRRSGERRYTRGPIKKESLKFN